jgi:hypothetical protein
MSRLDPLIKDPATALWEKKNNTNRVVRNIDGLSVLLFLSTLSSLCSLLYLPYMRVANILFLGPEF